MSNKTFVCGGADWCTHNLGTSLVIKQEGTAMKCWMLMYQLLKIFNRGEWNFRSDASLRPIRKLYLFTSSSTRLQKCEWYEVANKMLELLLKFYSDNGDYTSTRTDCNVRKRSVSGGNENIMRAHAVRNMISYVRKLLRQWLNARLRFVWTTSAYCITYVKTEPVASSALHATE